MFSSVQSLSHVQLFAIPWTAARQASLSITNSQSLPKLMSIELVMPSNHLILLSSPSPPALNLSQHQGLFKWVSSSHQMAKVLQFECQHQSFQWNTQDRSPLGWTGWISLQSKGLSSLVQHQFKSISSLVLSFLYSPTFTSLQDYWKNHLLWQSSISAF